MALIFPASASVGQTYQSGSSLSYTFNGSVWTLSAANTGIAALNEYTASLKQALQTTGSTTTMLGNLTVQGTQTALNQSSLQISDKTIRIASGSTTSAQSNGAGIIIDGANVTMSWDSSNSLFNMGTQLSASKFYGDGSGLTGVTSYTNADNLTYLNSKGVISGSRQLDGTFINNLSGSFTGSFKGDIVGGLTGTAQYASRVAVVTTGTTTDSTLYPIFTNTSASNAQNALLNHSSGAFYYDGVTRKVYAESFVGAIEANNNVISSSTQLTTLGYATTSSVTTISASAWGAFQSASSYSSSLATSVSASNYNITINSASVSSISASFTTRINAATNEQSLAHLLTTASYQTDSASFSSRINNITASVNINTGSFVTTSSFNAFTASAQMVTTGSNSFNGTQTITGSLIITTGSFVGSQIVANTSSLYLTSGSNMYVQNNGVVEITGSLIVSGSGATFNVPMINVTGRGGDEGGEINFAVPVTNTTLSTRVVADIYQNRLRFFDGNTNGVYIDLSKAPTGVAGEITWKSSGLINTGSFVQLDNIKAGPTRTGAGGGYAGLSIGAVSTSFVADVSAVYSNTTTGGQTITGTTYTTTASNSWNGWGFLQGQQSTYIVNDTTNSRVYRIILMIGASYNNNFVSIERLH